MKIISHFHLLENYQQTGTLVYNKHICIVSVEPKTLLIGYCIDRIQRSTLKIIYRVEYASVKINELENVWTKPIKTKGKSHHLALMYRVSRNTMYSERASDNIHRTKKQKNGTLAVSPLQRTHLSSYYF